MCFVVTYLTPITDCCNSMRSGALQTCEITFSLSEITILGGGGSRLPQLSQSKKIHSKSFLVMPVKKGPSVLSPFGPRMWISWKRSNHHQITSSRCTTVVFINNSYTTTESGSIFVTLKAEDTACAKPAADTYHPTAATGAGSDCLPT